MFTGIVTEVGRVERVERACGMRVRIAAPIDASAAGASIACDGVCLTVADGADGWFEADVSAETVSKTALGSWEPGRGVNLERPLRAGDELGGHIVTGHVDGLAELVGLREEGESTRVSFRAPPELARFIAPKGSVALNGTSLTVNEVEGREFGVNLIPHTKSVTNWSGAAVGDFVNLEVDLFARYLARLREAD